jgi:hypothetical protein
MQNIHIYKATKIAVIKNIICVVLRWQSWSITFCNIVKIYHVFVPRQKACIEKHLTHTLLKKLGGYTKQHFR